jgi:RND family efflux transporter MFP subunit
MRKIVLLLLLITAVAEAKEIYATFTVEAKQSANLAFNASGIVEKVNVDIGSVVKEDEILACLESEDIAASLQIAKTAMKYAKKDYKRQLQVKKIIDEASFDKYSFKYENAKAQMIYQQALLEKTVLKAPFDGVIFWKALEVGDTLSGTMIKTVLKIQSPHQRKLILSFDQKYWKDVKAGDRFKYRIDGDDRVYEGKISKVYPYANVGNRKIQAEVKALDIPVGLFGDGSIIVEEK